MSRIQSFKAEVLSIEFHETRNFFQRTLQEFWGEQKALNERMIALSKLLDTCLLLCNRNCSFQVMSTYWFFYNYAQHWGATVALGTLPLNRYSCFHLEGLGSHLTQLCLYIHTKETWLKYWEEKKKMTPKKKECKQKKYLWQKCHLERYRMPLMQQHTTTKL